MSLLSCLTTCSMGAESASTMMVMREISGMFRLSHGQRLDIKGTAGEKRGDASEHAGLVLDQHGQSVTICHQSSTSQSGAMPLA